MFTLSSPLERALSVALKEGRWVYTTQYTWEEVILTGATGDRSILCSPFYHREYELRCCLWSWLPSSRHLPMKFYLPIHDNIWILMKKRVISSCRFTLDAASRTILFPPGESREKRNTFFIFSEIHSAWRSETSLIALGWDVHMYVFEWPTCVSRANEQSEGLTDSYCGWE